MNSTPSVGFDFLLDRLPENKDQLSSDASTSYGMGGVLFFHMVNPDYRNFDGLFWQMSWVEWQKIAHMRSLTPGLVKINVAEFLKALITCETFSAHCVGKFSRVAIDNRAAVAWLNAARCPIYPFDRCAQGVHLHMLRGSQKFKADWIPSSMNGLVDTSRQSFSRKKSGHMVAGYRMPRVTPRWGDLLKFYKR